MIKRKQIKIQCHLFEDYSSFIIFCWKNPVFTQNLTQNHQYKLRSSIHQCPYFDKLLDTVFMILYTNRRSLFNKREKRKKMSYIGKPSHDFFLFCYLISSHLRHILRLFVVYDKMWRTQFPCRSFALPRWYSAMKDKNLLKLKNHKTNIIYLFYRIILNHYNTCIIYWRMFHSP